MKRTALRDILGALALSTLAGCERALPADDLKPDLSQPTNRCEGYDAGIGSFVFTLPPDDRDGGVQSCEQLCYELHPDTFLAPQVYCSDLRNDAEARVIECNFYRLCGRKPAGLAPAEVNGATPGAHFARCAHLEAASIYAFRRLARELRGHRLPRRLIEAAECAAGDELRHARAMSRLARRFGATIPSLRVRPMQPRPLVELAEENAAEGCVGETLGAAVALFQAQRATDPEVRRTMAAIAEDEVRHAELAWEIAAAVEPRLTRWERMRVAGARYRALRQLRQDVACPASLAEVAGLPTGAQAITLLDGVASAGMFLSEILRR